jgi:hypothetical protein
LLQCAAIHQSWRTGEWGICCLNSTTLSLILIPHSPT